MLRREAKYYVTGYEGGDPEKAPFYRRACESFDGPEGDFNSDLIAEYNDRLKSDRTFSEEKLLFPGVMERVYPEKIVVVNASGDDLPTSHETARIFVEKIRKYDKDVPVFVVSTVGEFSKFTERPERTLFFSQCVNKKVYNIRLARELEQKKAVIVPGVITAPGGVFSDKAATYELLSEQGKNWDMVARYKKIDPEGDSFKVSERIIEVVDQMARFTGDKKFFIKPPEGGGGLGGFRISKFGEKYYIPDLSKVTGRPDSVHPTFLDLDVEDDAKMSEALYIYRLFSSDPVMRKNYVSVDIGCEGGAEDSLQAMKRYVSQSRELRKKKIEKMLLSREEAFKVLAAAIEQFEKKFKTRYVPLVNEHIDFGLWGLRAHYRISREGPVLESMYHRLFQLAFTPEGIGYLGSDNISNKQTGDLEIIRLGPLNRVFLKAIGGRDALFDTLDKGVFALSKLRNLSERSLRERLPLRLQLDLAALSRKIGEGNADTARGMCLASRWDTFVANTSAWFEDGIDYYTWRKAEEGKLL